MPVPRTLRALAILGAISVALAGPRPAGADDDDPRYPLDTVSRDIPARGPFRCPEVDRVDYGGDSLRYSPRLRVYSGFRERLSKFERVVIDVAREVYGRPPVRIVDAGAFVCRRMTTYPEMLSEHGLGNAVDVTGFDFGPLPKGAKLPDGLPSSFRYAFQVRVDRHWSGKTRDAAVNARFLHALARRLIARHDIFRVLLGPGYPGHANHFHFDVSTFGMVQIFDGGRVLEPDAPHENG
jgi:hypothetical protein